MNQSSDTANPSPTIEGIKSKFTKYSIEDLVKLGGFVSLVTTAVSMSYVVGYFYGIHESLFMLSKLSDNLSFAWEAAPLALACIAVLALVIGIIKYILMHFADEKTDSNELMAKVSIISSLVIGALSIAVYFIFVKEIMIVAIGACCLAFAAWASRCARIDYSYFAPATILLLIGMALVAYVIGFMHSSDDLVNKWNARDQIEAENKTYLCARIVSCTDAGLLFIDAEAKEAVVLPLKALKAIRTPKEVDERCKPTK